MPRLWDEYCEPGIAFRVLGIPTTDEDETVSLKSGRKIGACPRKPEFLGITRNSRATKLGFRVRAIENPLGRVGGCMGNWGGLKVEFMLPGTSQTS